MKHSIKTAFLLVAILLNATLPTIAANPVKRYTIELNDSGIVIKDLGATKGGIFQSSNKKDLPKSIIINSIIVNYQGHQKDTLVVTANDSVISNKSVTNSLSADEMPPIVIETLKCYAFSHGKKIWTLRFLNNEKAPNPPSPLTPEAESSGQSIITVTAVALVIILFIAIFLFILRIKRKRRNTTSANKIKEGNSSEPSGETISINLTGDNPHDNEAHNDTQERKTEEDTHHTEGSDTGGEANPLPHDDATESNDNNTKLIKSILEALSLGDNQEDAIINKIKSLNEDINSLNEETTILKNDINALKNEEVINSNKASIQEEYANKLLKRIESEDKLKSIVEKAKQEENNSSPCSTLDRFFNILPSQIEKVPRPFENMINTTNNRIIATRWCIEQLSTHGYKKLDKRISPRPDDIFQFLADALNHTDELSKQNDADEHNDNDKSTDEQKNDWLNEIVRQINAHLPEGNKLQDITTVDVLITKIADMMTSHDMPEISNQSTEANQTYIDIVNNAFGSTITEMRKETLLSAAKIFFMKKIDIPEHQIGENVFNFINKNIKRSHELGHYLDTIGATTINDIDKAIRKKEYDDISKSIRTDLEGLFPNEHFETLQRLINKLVKLGRSSQENIGRIVDELDENITLLDSTHSAGEQDPLTLIHKYQALAEDEKKTLKAELDKKNDRITTLQEQNNQQHNKISEFEKEKEQLSDNVISTLHTLASQIEENINKSFMTPCSTCDESTCDDIETRLQNELSIIATQLKGYQAKAHIAPTELRHDIQQLLIQFLRDEFSPIDKVCRYYAYSKMAYMTDEKREEGIRFNRRNIGDLYDSINNLYTCFGIRFDIPTLFVMSAEDGHFNDLTGQNVYGDLDNLLPNSRNRLDYIDSESKPDKAIVDIVKVGYSLNGELKEKTSVLTF